MRTHVAVLVAVAVLAGSSVAPAIAQQQRKATTKAEVETWMKELSNWGRWGKDDRLGAVNLIRDNWIRIKHIHTR